MSKLLLALGLVVVAVATTFVLFQKYKAGPTQSTQPTLFADGVINGLGTDDYNPTLSPDGRTVFFTRRIDRRNNEMIMFSLFENGVWTKPQTANFSGKFFDKEPMFSTDGSKIFFASMRPNGHDEKANFDLWVSQKTDAGWSEPQNLGKNINSPGYDNYPSVATDGTLYFASVRIDGRKDNDLYRARFVNGQYGPAENLGAVINTAATEADPFIAPDQSYMIFSSDREGGMGEGDLYISFNLKDSWTTPQTLGKIINTATYEYTPLISPDGLTFYFSRGWGDIYQIPLSALKLSELKPRK
jgi:Tol biopolymer transport system component